MPYFPDVKGAPQNSIIGGASLWVMGGKSPEEYKGIAKFFTFLSDTDRQVYLHRGVRLSADHQGGLRKDQGLGLLRKEPDPRSAAEGTDQQAADREFARPALRRHGADARRLAEEIEAALAGKKSAKEALDAAVSRGNAMLRQFERTAVK